jgi:uncharacterized protein YndB with AHSA1/START domain
LREQRAEVTTWHKDDQLNDRGGVRHAPIARASVTIAAPAADVWEALVTPAAIKTYMFDATVTSDWVVGSPIVWIGKWQGRAYEDKGIILQIVRECVLEFSYFSPLAGVADLPENYHIVTVHLSSDGAQTRVSLCQDNNLTEEARERAERNWSVMLAGLKDFVEYSLQPPSAS